MRKTKLKKTLRKNRNHNKTSKKKKMIGGNPPRRSQRGLPTIEIPVVTLGTGSPVNNTYNNQTLDEEQIKSVVNEKIKIGYQIVSLPMPPDQSHSIIVEVSELGVMIIDWGGEGNRMMDSPKWENYTRFIQLLENKYGNIRYAEIDKDIYKKAYNRHKTNRGQGGCSEYVHNWINKYIGEEGTIGIIYIHV